MGVEAGILAAIGLGFLLGLKHATDADHVVAVSAIVTENRAVGRGLWIGAAWGVGHTTPLLILGIIILAFRGLIDGYESIATWFEFGVGVMMVSWALRSSGTWRGAGSMSMNTPTRMRSSMSISTPRMTLPRGKMLRHHTGSST